MSALPPITDAGRHIQVSIWLSVYEYTPEHTASGTNSVASGFCRECSQLKLLNYFDGWVAEWLKAPVLKTGRRASVSRVRIPPHPPSTLLIYKIIHKARAEIIVSEDGASAARMAPDWHPTLQDLFSFGFRTASIALAAASSVLSKR
jgi:hypothetical protein